MDESRKAREKKLDPRKNSVARPLKGHILPVGTRPIRQSESGAAVRLTRGSTLGLELG